jgi:hypothetical protein
MDGTLWQRLVGERGWTDERYADPAVTAIMAAARRQHHGHHRDRDEQRCSRGPSSRSAHQVTPRSMACAASHTRPVLRGIARFPDPITISAPS